MVCGMYDHSRLCGGVSSYRWLVTVLALTDMLRSWGTDKIHSEGVQRPGLISVIDPVGETLSVCNDIGITYHSPTLGACDHC